MKGMGIIMRFAKDLYISDGLIERKQELVLRLKLRMMKRTVYLIYLNRHSATPEFMNSIYLKQKYYKKYPMYVIGIVETYEQAMDYMAKLLENTFREKGNFNVKEIYSRC